ncbi:MAG: UDP-3-O-(3-hydroxymyristoyl)glucosamine N-acyltransferase [Planctomycetes bacterium]|nr:UDP-3-O-(3-hydroxymyristoyl)glucosamine N-acyltransferase [Planctomycetota bacterium]
MRQTLQEIAQLVAGRVVGDLQTPIIGAAILRDAQPGDLTLADHANKAAELARSQASAAIVPTGFPPTDIPCIVVDDVHAAFAKVVLHFRLRRPARPAAISPHAMIAPTAEIGPGVSIHPGAFLEDDVEIGAGAVIHSGARILAGCRIGENVTIFPGAVLYEDTQVGPRCIIHANVSLGAYGFGYKTTAGRHVLGAQLGYVVIEADVEIGAGTTIDRGSYGPTVIGEGTKIDNQVMIGHNCRIGRHNLLCSQVGIAGSTTTGDYVIIAGQVGVRDHVHIGERASLGAKAGIKDDVPPGAFYFGVPATPDRQQMKLQAAFAKLPEVRRQVKELQRQIEELKAARENDAKAA